MRFSRMTAVIDPAFRAALPSKDADAAAQHAHFSWECCMRMRDPQQQAALVLRLAQHWDLDNALTVTDLCRERLVAEAPQFQSAPPGAESPSTQQTATQQAEQHGTSQQRLQEVASRAAFAGIAEDDAQTAAGQPALHAVLAELAELAQQLRMYQAVIASPAGGEFRCAWQSTQ